MSIYNHDRRRLLGLAVLCFVAAFLVLALGVRLSDAASTAGAESCRWMREAGTVTNSDTASGERYYVAIRTVKKHVAGLFTKLRLYAGDPVWVYGRLCPGSREIERAVIWRR